MHRISITHSEEGVILKFSETVGTQWLRGLN